MVSHLLWVECMLAFAFFGEREFVTSYNGKYKLAVHIFLLGPYEEMQRDAAVAAAARLVTTVNW